MINVWWKTRMQYVILTVSLFLIETDVHFSEPNARRYDDLGFDLSFTMV